MPLPLIVPAAMAMAGGGGAAAAATATTAATLSWGWQLTLSLLVYPPVIYLKIQDIQNINRLNQEIQHQEQQISENVVETVY